MGKITARVCFTDEIPTVETVIAELEKLTQETILCKYLEDEDGLIGVEVTNERIAGGFTLLLPTPAEPNYEAFCGMGTCTYLLDAVAVVLQMLGGTFEYDSLLPAAAHQPWQLAKEWYQKTLPFCKAGLPSDPNLLPSEPN